MIARFAATLALAALLEAQSGEEIYRTACAQCHDGAVERAPGRAVLGLVYRESIVRSLASGLMAEQGRPLSPQSRAAVAAYLTARTEKDNANFLTAGGCAQNASPKTTGSWTRWGGDSANSRMQSARDAGLAASDVPKLRLAWAVGLPGEAAARSQPAVSEGRLFVGSGAGVVFALDARSGCRYWSYTADYGIRSGVIAAGQTIYLHRHLHERLCARREVRQANLEDEDR